MTQDDQKRAVAHEALQYVVTDSWIGVGSGSTANYFIEELAKIKGRIKGTVASSVKTADRLKALGIYVEELNNVDDVPVYVDGADEVTEHGAMIKGARRSLPPWRAGSCASSIKGSSCPCSENSRCPSR